MFLVVFDFDHTIIDANSDIYVNKLFSSDELRLNIEKNRSKFNCWTNYMQNIFQQLHKHHIKPNDYIEHMKTISLTNGFSHLIEYLYSLYVDDCCVRNRADDDIQLSYLKR